MSRFHLRLLPDAEEQLEAAFKWWGRRRSWEQAARWYLGILSAMETLRDDAQRHPFVEQDPPLEEAVREMHFGLGRRPSHRIMYRIEGQTVYIVAVLHSSQDSKHSNDREF